MNPRTFRAETPLQALLGKRGTAYIYAPINRKSRQSAFSVRLR